MDKKPLNKILYVEDEEDIQEIARLALEKVGGFTVKICGSGKEALENVVAFDPDLILLDVMMPEMDGMATFKKLRESEETARIPIIFMTAKVQDQDVEQYKTMGALDVISKPFQAITLSKTLTNIWRQHHE